MRPAVRLFNSSAFGAWVGVGVGVPFPWLQDADGAISHGELATRDARALHEDAHAGARDGVHDAPVRGYAPDEGCVDVAEGERGGVCAHARHRCMERREVGVIRPRCGQRDAGGERRGGWEFEQNERGGQQHTRQRRRRARQRPQIGEKRGGRVKAAQKRDVHVHRRRTGKTWEMGRREERHTPGNVRPVQPQDQRR